MPPLPVLQARSSPSADALRGLVNAVRGEVRTDRHNRMLYATDASLYQVEPWAVVIPDSIDDAIAAFEYCRRAGLAVLPRGGGTSLAGQCTNRAVVIDLSPNCRRVVEVDAGGRRCRVEPGITVDDLNDHLAGLGGEAAKLFFAPDPATSRHATIGGCIGNNAAGARSILYGRTSENVLGVDVALSDGSRVTLCEQGAARDPRVLSLTRALAEIILPLGPLIRERFPRTVRRNAGYQLDMVLAALEAGGAGAWRGSHAPGTAIPAELLSRVNLANLICGSEGTLAVTLRADLLLRERPACKGLAVLGFESLDSAIASVLPILATRPSAVELLDDTVIDLARANAEYRRYVDLMPRPERGELKAVLYVEYFAGSRGELESSREALERAAGGAPRQWHTDAGAMLNAWKLRKAGEPLLHGVPGRRKPITFIEDNAVPVERLSEFVRELRRLVEAHSTRAAFYAHASVGVLHVRPLIDLHDPADRERMRSIAVQAADLARSLGGVMSGEHGDGRVRTPLLERFYGPEIMRAFREVKRLFDPADLLNPGDVVDLTGDHPRPVESITDNLRVDLGIPPARPAPDWSGVETYFDYADQHGFDGAVEMCNGAGVCRKKQGGTMCPSYMATLDERHSTRGRGNALRLAITGQLGPLADRWSDPGAVETLDLCLSCKACKTECPSNVDIARLKAEFAAQRFRQRGRPPLRTLLFGAVRTLNRLGSMFPGAANWFQSGPARAPLNLLMGLDPRRSLPRFATPLDRLWGQGAGTPPGARPRVVLFGDCFTMFNEPGIGLAAKRVFEACGYDVGLANAGCCGRAKISSGLLAQAVDEIDATLARLRGFGDDPRVHAVLVAEPSCLSAIKDDWLQLRLATPRDVRRRLAAKAFLPEEFLDKAWDRHPARPAFAPAPATPVLLHGHCHQKALWGDATSAGALRRVFPAGVRVVDSGCCGMAGSFGYARHRYDLSMKIGERALFPAVREAGDASIAAPGTSCRHQIHDATGHRALHPIELIAEQLAGSTYARA